jgi:hypothetical protein
MLPTFICVGPGRAGTSWLYEVLLEHPEVCMAKDIKETQFFNQYYAKGIDWYERFFDECNIVKVRGEISNRYFVARDVPARIKEAIPDCKIIFCMRNPYERIQSVYSFKLREGALNCSFEEALIKMPELIEDNRYYTLISPYYNLFGKNKIFPLYFDDIKERPYELCRDLFRFLDVRADFIPQVVEKQVNKAIVPRFPMVAVIAKTTAKILRSISIYKPLTWAKRSDVIKRLFFKAYDYKSENLMSVRARAMMDPIILPEIAKLEGLIGKDLSSWKGR